MRYRPIYPRFGGKRFGVKGGYIRRLINFITGQLWVPLIPTLPPVCKATGRGDVPMCDSPAQGQSAGVARRISQRLQKCQHRIDLLRREYEFGHGGMAGDNALGERLGERFDWVLTGQGAEWRCRGQRTVPRSRNRMTACAIDFDDRLPPTDPACRLISLTVRQEHRNEQNQECRADNAHAPLKLSIGHLSVPQSGGIGHLRCSGTIERCALPEKMWVGETELAPIAPTGRSSPTAAIGKQAIHERTFGARFTKGVIGEVSGGIF